MRLFVQSEAESGKFPEVSRVLHLAVINPTLHTKRLTKDTVTVTVIGGIGQLKKWGKPRRTPLEAVCVTLFGAAGYVPQHRARDAAIKSCYESSDETVCRIVSEAGECDLSHDALNFVSERQETSRGHAHCPNRAVF